MIYPKRSEYYEIRTKDHKGGNSARMCEICAISICCVLSAMQEGFDALIVFYSVYSVQSFWQSCLVETLAKL